MLPLCDYITIHVPYLPTTKDTINAQTLALCKDGVKILNYARGELVNTEALLEAMETGKVSGYMTDFPSEAILGKPGIVCTPHLGASTPEAEDNCAAMAVQEISDYLKNGNITHSVNMPCLLYTSKISIHCGLFHPLDFCDLVSHQNDPDRPELSQKPLCSSDCSSISLAIDSKISDSSFVSK